MAAIVSEVIIYYSYDARIHIYAYHNSCLQYCIKSITQHICHICCEGLRS